MICLTGARPGRAVPGPGCWPDCDMLPVGRLCKDAPYHGAQNRMSNFTPDEVRTMFTLWGIFRSPLFLGGDLPEMPADVLAMLTNGDYLQMHAASYGARELLRRETNGRGTIQWVAAVGAASTPPCLIPRTARLAKPWT